MTEIESSILRSFSLTVARLQEAKYVFIVLVHFIGHGKKTKHQFPRRDYGDLSIPLNVMRWFEYHLR